MLRHKKAVICGTYTSDKQKMLGFWFEMKFFGEIVYPNSARKLLHNLPSTDQSTTRSLRWYMLYDVVRTIVIRTYNYFSSSSWGNFLWSIKMVRTWSMCAMAENQYLCYIQGWLTSLEIDELLLGKIRYLCSNSYWGKIAR